MTRDPSMHTSADRPHPLPSRRLPLPELAAAFYAGALLWLGALAARGTGPAPLTAALSALTIVLYGGLTLIVLRRPDDPRARLFALTGAMVVLTLLLTPLPADAPATALNLLYALLYVGVFAMIPAVVVHLSAWIAGPHPVVRRNPLLLPGVYLACALATAALFAAYSNALRPWLPWPTPMVPSSEALATYSRWANVAAGAAGVAMLNDASHTAPTLEGRRQALVVFAGLLPYTLVMTSWIVAPSLHRYPLVVAAEAVVILFVPVTLAVSIVRHQLFEATVVIRRGLVYGLTIGLLAGLVFLAAEAAARVARPTLGETFTRVGLALLFVVAGAFFRPTARRIGAAVDRRIFPEKLELRRLERGIIAEMVGFTTLRDAGAHLVARLRESLQLERASLLMAEPEQGTLRLLAIAVRDDAGPAPEPVVLPLEALEPWRERLERGEPFERSAADAEGPALRAALDRLGARAVVPVLLRDRLIGLLLLGAHAAGHALEGDDFEQLGSLGRQVSAMLENVRLFDLATRDPLTSLPRRHVAMERLAQEVERCRRSFHPLSILFADVDRFKQINDRLGHAAGDAVLRAVAATLAGATRRTDLLSRFGGEEFLVILPETGLEGARVVAEALRRRVAETPVHAGEARGEPVRLTISIGVCAVEDASALEDADALIRRADEALYRAKAAGRDRVEEAGPAAGSIAS